MDAEVREMPPSGKFPADPCLYSGTLVQKGALSISHPLNF